jgi:hypothetical protein
MHKSSCNNEKGKSYNYKAYQYIRNNGGWENWSMYMIEQYAANSKYDLERRERYYYDLLKPALNCNIPTRPKEEYYQDNKEHINQYKKQYREDHKEYFKQYYQDNKKHIKERENQYRKDNKEHINQRKKQYRKDNKEHINQYKKQYREKQKHIQHMCECGKIYNKNNKTIHYKSKHHKTYIKNPFINIYKHL